MEQGESGKGNTEHEESIEISAHRSSKSIHWDEGKWFDVSHANFASKKQHTFCELDCNNHINV